MSKDEFVEYVAELLATDVLTSGEVIAAIEQALEDLAGVDDRP